MLIGRFNYFVTCSGIACLIVFCLWSPPVRAATITVNSMVDEDPAVADGDCTLREAIIAANTNTAVDACTGGDAGVDTIEVPTGIYILLEGGASEDAADSGDLDITEDLTIIGTGAGLTVIDGAADFLVTPDRVFDISPGGENADVTIQSLTIRAGESAAGGGVLSLSPGTATFEDCEIIDNTSTGPGGGIYSDAAGPLTIRRCKIDHNAASAEGGGIRHDGGTLTIENSSVSDNASGSAGGGILQLNGNFDGMNLTVNGNAATGYGGGIYHEKGDFSLTGDFSTVDHNDADGFGGGLYLDQSDTTLENVSASYNTSTSTGGGIMHLAADFSGENITVNGNVVGGSAGGMYHEAGDVSITGESNTIDNNTANDFAGGLYAEDGGLILENVSLSNNSAGNNGGGLLHLTGEFSGSHLSIVNNMSNARGGGIYKEMGALTLTDSRIERNLALDDGGAIFHDGAALNVSNTSINENFSDALGGGIAFVSATDGAALKNLTLSGNTATTSGGGIYHNGGAASTVLNATIAENNAPMGSNIFNDTGSLEVQNSIVSNGIDGDDCDGAGTITSLGNNIDSGTTCGFTAGGDQEDTDPLLLPLADNGGIGTTQSLEANSPAIDKANDAAAPATDQRGVARIDGDGDGIIAPDIGAVEFGCPDGVLQAGEECDDGNLENTDACLNTCINATCGDGFVEAGVEECDDGNNEDGDSCAADCTNEEAADSGGGCSLIGTTHRSLPLWPLLGALIVALAGARSWSYKR